MGDRPRVVYGAWPSSISTDLVVTNSVRLSEVRWAGEVPLWLEGRPQEQGRNVLVRGAKMGMAKTLTPQPFNVRSRVHEYGGGAFLAVGQTLYFSHDGDRCIYRQVAEANPERLTTPGSSNHQRRYTDFVLDNGFNRLIGVCEEHSQGSTEPENSVVSIDLTSGQVESLISGCDFYSSPRLSPDGTQLAWVSWNHPHMPWDRSQLWVATVQGDGALGSARCLAGEPEESIAEPRWSPDGHLYFVSDRHNWWNFYRWAPDHTAQANPVEGVYAMAAEFTYPHWVFGLSSYDFISASRLLCTYCQQGRWYLAELDLIAQNLQPIALPYTDISSVQVQGNRALFIGSTPTDPTAVVCLNLSDHTYQELQRSTPVKLEHEDCSVPEAIAFASGVGQTAYGWFYPPCNQAVQAPEGTLPPLIVKSHGGPTAQASAGLDLKVQYWTSRGFAVLDVNYGGSTGYGRAYRQRLEGKWGLVDVDDCVNGANYLVAQGKVDGKQLVIAGSSAGGYTTLAALTFRDCFQVGASYYGISDLAALVRDTHKFESRYLDHLVGPYPEAKERYDQRSPIHHTEQLSCPAIFFQGLEDSVVPPSQAEAMVQALQRKGMPVAYVPFAGEQHGFRQAETIKRALSSELYFYAQVLGFPVTEAIEAIEIYNLPK